ncbi:MAG: hypothetical protein H7144_15765 [Burkholderiales bacterium]|nr:hypothetical protein [Phycisphaerae bacterium]
MQSTASLEQAVSEFRRMLPAASATARAIDRGDPWDGIAINAVADGYIESANEMGRFLEACLKRSV